MDHYSIDIDLAEMPSIQELKEDDAFFALGRGYGSEVARALDCIEDLGELGNLIAAVIKDYKGTPAQKKDCVFLARVELREYLARVLAKEMR